MPELGAVVEDGPVVAVQVVQVRFAVDEQLGDLGAILLVVARREHEDATRLDGLRCFPLALPLLARRVAVRGVVRRVVERVLDPEVGQGERELGPGLLAAARVALATPRFQEALQRVRVLAVLVLVRPLALLRRDREELGEGLRVRVVLRAAEGGEHQVRQPRTLR